MKTKPFLIVSLVLALALLLVTPASAFFSPSDGQAATLVLGQPDFTSSTSNTNQSGMNHPFDVAVDPTSGKVFVADANNSRVLRFAKITALSNGTAAEAVLGQPNFASSTQQTTQNGMNGPVGLAVDTSGRLWVADLGNNRILRFDNAASKANGANADGVLGEPDFTSSDCNVTRSGMCFPADVDVDASGRLWVADGADRALRFDNAAVKANGANADGVLGQPDFTSSGGSLTQSGMPDPHGVAVDASGRLWVVENDANRVVRYDNAAAKANGANADGVLGQPDFTSGGGNVTQSGMFRPTQAAVDTSGRLYVADTLNNRILVFDSAASLPNGSNASNVLGQTDFTTSSFNTGGLSASTLCNPSGMFYDPAARVLWATDICNNRVLMYGSLNFHIPPVIGLINFYLPPGTTVEGIISIQAQDGSIQTFEVTRNTRILPPSRASQLGIGSSVMVLARQDPATGQMMAVQIVVHPAEFGAGSGP